MSEIIILSGHTNFNTGGVGTHLRVLNDELVKKDINHRVLLGKNKGYSGISFLSRKLIPKKIYFQFNIQVSGLYNKLKKNISIETKVVDCHDLASVIAAITLREKKRLQYKVVYTVHAPFYEQYLLSGKKIDTKDMEHLRLTELKYLKKCDGFVCVDDKQRDIIETKISRSVNNIILPNAVNIDFLDTVERNSNVEKYIIISRHLYEKCGVSIGIKAFAKADIDSNIKLVIVGMGDQYESLLSLTENLNISNRVEFKGRLVYEESIKYTANAIITLIPSIPLGDYVEATSLSMLEGMALGVPVIASNIGGLKQVLENTGAGILVEPNNISVLAEKIEILVGNQSLRESLSKKAKILVNKEYASAAWLAKRLDFYKENI